MKYIIEFTKESGEVILTENASSELSADRLLDNLYEFNRGSKKYKNLVLNLSEFGHSAHIGKVRLVAINDKGDRFIRREFYRLP